MDAVGIGCCWFTLRNAESIDVALDKFSPEKYKKYIADVTSILESIENITQVNISQGKDSWSVTYSDSCLFPLVSPLTIDFDILMSDRLQNQFGSGRVIKGAETFHVKIISSGDAPIFLVNYSISTNDEEVFAHSPSHAVVFISKYLEQRVKDHPSIEFSVVGPSPFHSDFFISDKKPDIAENENGSSLVDVTPPTWRVYRSFIFHPADPGKDGMIDFIFEHQEAISTFYESELRRLDDMRLYGVVIDGARELLARNNRLLGRAVSIWKKKRKIDETYDYFLRLKMFRIETDRYFESVKKRGTTGIGNVFVEYVEQTLKDVEPFPDEDLRSLLVMVEERRLSSARNLIGFASGLLGAAIGALLSFALTPHDGIASRQALPTPAITEAPKATKTP